MSKSTAAQICLWLTKILVTLIGFSGCVQPSAAVMLSASPSPFAFEDFAEAPKPPEPKKPTGNSPDKADSPPASKAELPVVLGYSPKWCSVCPMAKRDSAKSTTHKFIWEDDESKFPQWVRDDLKKNDQRPPGQKHGFPYLEWKNATGWWYLWGWSNLAEFNRRSANTLKPVNPKTVADSVPHFPSDNGTASSAAALYCTPYTASGWSWDGDLRQHLREHGFSAAQIAAMSDGQCIATHDAQHDAAETPRRERRRKRRHG